MKLRLTFPLRRPTSDGFPSERKFFSAKPMHRTTIESFLLDTIDSIGAITQQQSPACALIVKLIDDQTPS